MDRYTNNVSEFKVDDALLEKLTKYVHWTDKTQYVQAPGGSWWLLVAPRGSMWPTCELVELGPYIKVLDLRRVIDSLFQAFLIFFEISEFDVSLDYTLTSWKEY